MKLHSLEIKNFRAIEDISLDFTDLLRACWINIKPGQINDLMGIESEKGAKKRVKMGKNPRINAY